MFFPKKQSTCFFNPGCLFLKETVFIVKYKKPILNCFYCIMQHHHFQKYTIIAFYTYYGIQIWG